MFSDVVAEFNYKMNNLLSKKLKFDLLKFSKYLYWVILVLILLSIPAILYLNSKGFISNPLQDQTSIIETYSNSLAFVFSIIGFLVAVIIFLIQHISAKYHAEELEGLPIFLKYFITTLFMLLFFIGFNFFSLYFNLGFPYREF